MVTEKGILPIGVEYDNKYQKEYELRPLKVREIIEIDENQKESDSDTYQSILVFKAMLVKLGTIPKNKITDDILLDMYETDIKELAEARERLDKKLKTLSGKKRKRV